VNRNRARVPGRIFNLSSGAPSWRLVRNQASSTTEIYLYDEISYWGVTAADFVRELQDVDTDEISLHINSPGGDVFEGIAILNSLRQHNAKVSVTVDGLAASAASFIAMAGDSVTMARNSELMIHDALGFVLGNAADMQDMAELLNRTSDNIASIYAERAGGEVADWRKAMVAETWYSAQDAVDAGLADQVDGHAAGGETNSWDLSLFNRHPEAPLERRPLVAARAPVTQPEEPFVFDAEAFRLAMEEAGNA
jgi:ATP-dependent Clp endopeptidase proteolytic subunit ClpP